jgi:late competence protein required for DNA uptake (superfamily II DNA/RNA helicase)
MADWKIKLNKRCSVCNKIRNVNRGLAEKRRAGFDLYCRDCVMNHTSSISNYENLPPI